MKTYCSFLLMMGLGFWPDHGIDAAQMVLVAGGGQEDPRGQAAEQVRLREPFGVAFDANDNLFIIEMSEGNRLLKLDPHGHLHHVAGTGALGDGGDGGPSRQASFNGPHNIAVLPNGDVLVADTWNGRIRRVQLDSGTVTSLPGFDVGPDQGRRAGPYCITLDFPGRFLYVADLRRVHRLDVRTGRSEPVAGNGQKGAPEDGALATEAPLVDPRAAAVDQEGRLYILERGGHALRVVDLDGRIRTVVNTSGRAGSGGDAGDARDATLRGPKHLCVDHLGNVMIADAENHLIRKYVPASGQILRVAGTGRQGAGELNQSPTEVALNRPHGVTIHPRTGQLYITDSYNHRILKVVE